MIACLRLNPYLIQSFIYLILADCKHPSYAIICRIFLTRDAIPSIVQVPPASCSDLIDIFRASVDKHVPWHFFAIALLVKDRNIVETNLLLLVSFVIYEMLGCKLLPLLIAHLHTGSAYINKDHLTHPTQMIIRINLESKRTQEINRYKSKKSMLLLLN